MNVARPLDIPVQRHPRVVWRAFDDEIAIVAPWAGQVHTLTDVAARCWELADGRTVEQIMEVLLQEFDVEPEVLRKDLEEFLDELDKRKLLEWAGE